MQSRHNHHFIKYSRHDIAEKLLTWLLRNKSWKPECVLSFNMDWWMLVFYPEPEARDKIY